MESAEHRTKEGDEKRQDLPDEELSFSMRPPQEPRQERRPPAQDQEPRDFKRAPGERDLAEPPPVEAMETYFEDPTADDFQSSEPQEYPFEEHKDTPEEHLERAFDEPEEALAPRFEEEEQDFPPRRQGPGPRPSCDTPEVLAAMGRAGMGRPKPLIQDVFKRGQEVLVQVIKEGIGTKGPTLSTYISIAGRYLVLMPGLNRIGVSRKIIDEDARRRLRDILNEMEPPRGLGFIIRTAGIDRNKKELQRDLAYLSRLWEVVVRRVRKTKSPCEIYQESDMITRTIRDIFTSEIDSITVDEKNAYEHAKEFLQIVMPRFASRINRNKHHVRGIDPRHGERPKIRRAVDNDDFIMIFTGRELLC